MEYCGAGSVITDLDKSTKENPLKEEWISYIIVDFRVYISFR